MADSTATKPYADYSWYSEDYGGALLDESTFPHYAKWASYLIDSLTYGNIDSDDKVYDCVKDATCCAAELGYNYWHNSVYAEGGRGTKSETNDGYSISYDDTLLTAESLQEECYAQIRVYLANSGLLYRGVKNRKPRRWFPW